MSAFSTSENQLYWVSTRACCDSLCECFVNDMQDVNLRFRESAAAASVFGQVCGKQKRCAQHDATDLMK